MPFVLVLPAVVLAAALWGRWPGVLVLGLGMLSSLPSLLLPGIAVLPGGPLLVPLLLLAGMGMLLVALGVRLRDLRRRARAAEARLVLAIEGTGMGVFEVDLASRRVHLSPGLARRVGLPADPVPLDRWLARMPPDVLARLEGELRQQLRQRAKSYEQTLHLPLTNPGTAGVEWLLLRLQIDWDGSRAMLLRGVCLDITDPKRVEHALAEARHALQQQVDDLDLLHQLSSRLLEDGSLEQQLGEIVQTLAQYHGSARGLVAVLEQGGTRLGLAAAQGLTEAHLAQIGAAMAAMAAPGAQALAQHLGQRVVVEDTETAPTVDRWREMARSEGFRAVHCTPLISRGGALLGAIAVLLDQPRQPTERECRLADICARKAAVFIERARAQAELAAGFNHHLTKPVDVAQLLQMVAQATR